MKPGVWIRIAALFPGVWKVYRVLSNFQEDRWSLEDPAVKSTRVLVFCYRLVNDNWKRSFSHQVVELFYVTPLTKEDSRKLDDLEKSDPKLLRAFEKYQEKAKALDLIANISLGGLSREQESPFPAICAEMLADRIEDGITLDQALEALQSRGLDSCMRKYPQLATLQLVSIGHELRGEQFLYRQFNVLNF